MLRLTNHQAALDRHLPHLTWKPQSQKPLAAFKLPAPYQNVPECPHSPVLASTKKGNCESHYGLSQLWHGSKKPLYGLLQLLRWAAPSGATDLKAWAAAPQGDY